MARKAKEGVYFIKQQCFDSIQSGKKAINSQAKTLKRLLSKYSCGGFVMGLSECDGRIANKVNLNKGKVGRPKVGFANMFRNQPNYHVKPHIHIYIYGFRAASVAREFVEIGNRQYRKKHPDKRFKHAFSQVRRKDGCVSFEYIEQQSCCMRYGGDKELLKEYCKV